MLETSDVGRVFLVLFELGLHGVEIDLSLSSGGLIGRGRGYWLLIRREIFLFSESRESKSNLLRWMRLCNC